MINWCIKLPGGLNRFRAESNLRMDFHNVVEKDHLEIYLVILSIESLRSLLDEQRDTIWAGYLSIVSLLGCVIFYDILVEFMLKPWNKNVTKDQTALTVSWYPPENRYLRFQRYLRIIPSLVHTMLQQALVAEAKCHAEHTPNYLGGNIHLLCHPTMLYSIA